MKPQKGEMLRHDPYLGPEASFLKPWKLAIWIALVCSVVSLVAQVLAPPPEFSRRLARQNAGVIFFFNRLSVLYLLGICVALWIRVSPQRLRQFVSAFVAVPMWKGIFQGDDLDARVLRRVQNLRLAFFGTSIVLCASLPWLITVFLQFG
jgi:hypothetical protein